MKLLDRQVEYRSVFPFLLTACLLAAIPTAGEAKVIPIGIEQLAKEASWIVEGHVTEVHSDWSPDHTQIYTFVTITRQKLHKGTYEDRAFRLRILGGVVDGIGMAVEDSPVFSHGEQVILFLGPNPQAFFPTVGLSQGAFKLSRDAETGEEMATNSQGMSLSKADLEERIRRALAR